MNDKIMPCSAKVKFFREARAELFRIDGVTLVTLRLSGPEDGGDVLEVFCDPGKNFKLPRMLGNIPVRRINMALKVNPL